MNAPAPSPRPVLDQLGIPAPHPEWSSPAGRWLCRALGHKPRRAILLHCHPTGEDGSSCLLLWLWPCLRCGRRLIRSVLLMHGVHPRSSAPVLQQIRRDFYLDVLFELNQGRRFWRPPLREIPDDRLDHFAQLDPRQPPRQVTEEEFTLGHSIPTPEASRS